MTADNPTSVKLTRLILLVGIVVGAIAFLILIGSALLDMTWGERGLVALTMLLTAGLSWGIPTWAERHATHSD